MRAAPPDIVRADPGETVSGANVRDDGIWCHRVERRGEPECDIVVSTRSQLPGRLAAESTTAGTPGLSTSARAFRRARGVLRGSPRPPPPVEQVAILGRGQTCVCSRTSSPTVGRVLRPLRDSEDSGCARNYKRPKVSIDEGVTR